MGIGLFPIDDMKEAVIMEKPENALLEEAAVQESSLGNEAQTERKIIGRASATRRDFNTSDEFSFWIASGEKVNPTDIVEAENSDGSRTYGLVSRIDHPTDSDSHLDNYISSDFGTPDIEPATQRIGTNVGKAVVLKNTANLYMPVQNNVPIRFADPTGINLALGLEELREPIRAGIIELTDGTQAIAYIDRRFLLGPEGAHINVSGISGLATKTSYAMFLLQSLLQEYPQDTAAIIFNVKYDDLLYIDQEPENLTDEDRELWEALELEPRSFKEARYFLPRGRKGKANSVSIPVNNQIYSYDLKDVIGRLPILFIGVSDPRGALEALVHDIDAELQEGVFQGLSTFAALRNHDRLSKPLENTKRRKAKQWIDHYQATVGRFRRLLWTYTSAQTSGIFVNAKGTQEITLRSEIRKIKDGNVYVIDIYNLNDRERAFVFGDVIQEVYRLYTEGAEEGEKISPPKKLIVFVDELNKYAPSTRERETPLLENLLEITERGRSLGVILFGVEQFASAVHPRIIGNMSTKVYGRTDSSELGNVAYRYIPEDLRALMTRLEKGRLLLYHAVYRQPVQIRFPRPAYREPSG